MNFISFKIELSLSMVVCFFAARCLCGWVNQPPLLAPPPSPPPLPLKVATLDEQYQNNAAPKGHSSGLKAGPVPRQSFDGKADGRLLARGSEALKGDWTDSCRTA